MSDDWIKDIEEQAAEHAKMWKRRFRALQGYRYDEQQEKYWDIETGLLCSARSVDGSIPRSDWPQEVKDGKVRQIKPSVAINAIESGLTVESSTWWPGKPQLIRDLVCTDRGMLTRPGAMAFNTYAPSDQKPMVGDASPWVNHVKTIYPDPVQHEHFFDWCAHCVQKPGEKVNHGIVLGGRQGIGKDAALLPVRNAVGTHNVTEIEPDDIVKPYNGYRQSVLVVLNEVRPHERDFKAYSFYNQLKPLLASPPEVLAVERKYFNPIYIPNVCHVAMTTNDPLSMFIPEGDRRLFVMDTDVGPREDKYFNDLYDWMRADGLAIVFQWLLDRDLSNFAASTPPVVSSAKEKIQGISAAVRRSPVDDVLDDFLSKWANLNVVFLNDLLDSIRKNEFDGEEELIGLAKGKSLIYKMNERGFIQVRRADGAKYKSGENQARSAYVRESFLADPERNWKPNGPEINDLIIEELGYRPLKAARIFELGPKNEE